METFEISADQFPTVQYRKSGSGPALMLLHGFPEDGSLWNQVVPALSGSFRVIVPDMPGAGGSALPAGNPSLDVIAPSLEVILNKEQINEVVLVGHSMGGYVSLAFAEKYRPWLKGLSMVHSTAFADSEEKKQARVKSVELIRKGGKEPFVKGMIPNLFATAFREAHPEVIQRQVERGLKLSEESMAYFYNAMINRPERTNILRDAGFPVQWIVGKEDQLIATESALQQSSLASVNFVSLYENCGHMSMLEQPERLANDLRDFAVYCYNR